VVVALVDYLVATINSLDETIGKSPQASTIALIMSGPRVYNGREWLPVPAVRLVSNEKPIEPILDGDGKIFVSIVSYRGMFLIVTECQWHLS
jgi:hypothetical protein